MDALRKSIGSDESETAETPVPSTSTHKKPAAKAAPATKGITLIKSETPAKPAKAAKRKSA